MEVEICIESISEAELATQFGAKRVELCSALDLGGLTPSIGMIENCSAISEIEVHVLVRPRSGDFCYSDQEFDVMKNDIQSAKEHDAKGVVVGILTPELTIDISRNKALLELARSLEMEATFHRAFDLASDPIQALDQIIELGFHRLLSSGQQPTAIEGVSLITDLVERSQGRIEIMAGSGVNGSNVEELATTGIDAVHFSSRKKLAESSLGMGSNYIADNEKISAVMNKITA